MFLSSYLTNYDPDLAGDTYLDPMGTLIVWSSFGQQIFRSRVNSISNDVRNYTLNLLNHYITRRVVMDDRVVLNKALVGVYGGKDQPAFKHACLLFLENLFAFSVMHQVGRMDSLGVLGGSKASRLWQEQGGNPLLTFAHDKNGQILVRQLSLGVSGRYKTPFRELHYFDDHYHYDLPSTQGRWAEAERFIRESPLSSLVDEVYPVLCQVIAKGGKAPAILFKDIPAAVPEAYTHALASSRHVGTYARHYWLAVTELDQGAAGGLLAVLDRYAGDAARFEAPPQALVREAFPLVQALNDKRKLEHIQILEPFLADLMLFFSTLTARKSQSLSDAISHWNACGRDERTLPGGAARVAENPDLVAILDGTALVRLRRLLNLAHVESLDAQARLVTDYHTQVMVGRGQSSWLTLEPSGRIAVHVRPSPLPSPQDWPPGRWYNGYYLPQFRSLVSGYQGLAA